MTEIWTRGGALETHATTLSEARLVASRRRAWAASILPEKNNLASPPVEFNLPQPDVSSCRTPILVSIALQHGADLLRALFDRFAPRSV